MSTLRGDDRINFDVYLPLRGKQVLYIRKGDNFEGERLVRLKAKKLKKLYIVEEDEPNYREYVQTLLTSAYDPSSPKSLDLRADIIQGANQGATEDVLESPENEMFYNIAKEGAEKFVKFLQEEPNAMAPITRIANLDGNIAHHGVTVATLALGVAAKLGLQDPKFLQMLALGAFLHDFGHTIQKLDINKPLADFGPTEMTLYKSHPRLGAEHVQGLKHFDSVVVQIIMQHEEKTNGSGYPKGLKESEIRDEAVIVGIANGLDRLVAFEGKSIQEAAKIFYVDAMGKYPLDHLNALREVIKSQNTA